MILPLSPEELTDLRKLAVLDAASAVFARHGFRKTSMDEVARAAGVSRQGLYLQFANKEELFRKTLEHSLSCQLNAAIAALASEQDSLEVRLVAACSAWSGRLAHLMCTGTSCAGTTLEHFESRFELAMARAIGDSPLRLLCAREGLCPADLARALHATARGLKQCSASREEFVKTMTVAARMFCAPLAQRDQGVF